MSDPLRFFVPAATIATDEVKITGEEFHHLRNVLRVNTGQTVLLLDGKGNVCQVEITASGRKSAAAVVKSRWQAEKNAFPITLIQSLPKTDKFELILQKGTELGISCFQPIITEHTIPSLSGSRLQNREQRWQRIVREAARQSRCDFLPDIKPLICLDQLIDKPSTDLKLILWEAGSVPLTEVLPNQQPSGVQLLVGPEGGFSEQEIAAVVAAGFKAVHLGPRILRTETAGLAATPVLQYLYGDWQQPPMNDTPT